MPAVVVYGSLIHPGECAGLGISTAQMQPVIITGYRRMFHQEPVFRKGNGINRAVLNTMPQNGYSLNAILIRDINRQKLSLFDKRESGYFRQRLSGKKIAPEPAGEENFIYLGKTGRQNQGLLPNTDYLRICLQGARFWGEDFYSMFLETTFIGRQQLQHWTAFRKFELKKAV
jgi:hypothetical protein